MARIPAAELAFLPVTMDIQDMALSDLVLFLARDLALPVRATGIDHASQPPITLRVNRLRFSYLLEFVCKLTDLKIDVGADGVLTLHPIPPEPAAVSPEPPVPEPAAAAPPAPFAFDLECLDATPAEFALAYSHAMGFTTPIRLAEPAEAGERVSVIIHEVGLGQPRHADYPELFFHTEAYAWPGEVTIHAFPQQPCLQRIISIDRNDCPLSELLASISTACGLRLHFMPHSFHGIELPMPHVTIHAQEGIEVSHLLNDLSALFLTWSMAGDGSVVLFPMQSPEENKISVMATQPCISIPVQLSDHVVSVDYHALPLGAVARDLHDRHGIPMTLNFVDIKRPITLRLDHRSLSDVLSALTWICGPDSLRVLVTTKEVVLYHNETDLASPQPARPVGDDNF